MRRTPMAGRGRAGMRLAAAWLALALPMAPGARAQGCPAPTLRTIVVDGDFSDWTEVLANPANASRDGDGSTVVCASSTDRDCPVSDVKLDISRLAWTSDATHLFFYLERLGTGGGSQDAVFYIDLGHDGLLETLDRVVSLRISDPSPPFVGDIFGYLPLAAGGDPLTSPVGMADGWTLPGDTRDVGIAGRPEFRGDVPEGTVFEFRVAWSDLGVAADSPLLIHASMASGRAFPQDVRDNAGAGDGGVVDTARRLASIAPVRTLGAAPGTTASLRHVVVNAGNLAGRIDAWSTASAGHDVTWRADADGDGAFETLLAHDAAGDGILTLPGDVLDAAGDSNGDGTLDLGVVPASGSVSLELSVTVPADAGSVTEALDVEVHFADRPECRSSVSDLLRIGDVTLARDERRLGVPGQPAWISHVVQNNLTRMAVVDFSSASVRGWPYAFFADPDGDGAPADAVPLADSNLNGLPDMTLAPGETASLLVRAAVPASAPVGQTETVFVRAHLDGPPTSSVVDRITLGDALVLAPSHRRVDGNARYGAAGFPVYFAHRVVNGASAQSLFDLSVVSDLGWTVTLLSDPDGDGRPYDSLPLPPGPVTVAINGGELPFIVRADVPVGARLGDLSTLTVQARGAVDASVFEQVEDDAIVAIIRVFDEPSHVLSVGTVQPCGTAFCLASGLPPSAPDHRFEWRDASGAVIRTTLATTSPQGECADALALGPADAGVGWSVAIQRFEFGAWVTLDVAQFSVAEGLTPVALILDAPVHDISSSAFSAALEVTNASFDTAVSGQSLRWEVLTPDLTQVLLPNATWAPWTGREATQVDAVDLAPGESRVYALSKTGVVFPMQGAYAVRVHRSSPCGIGETLLIETQLLVTDDPDGDGLRTADEIAAGTDPLDADSDDDGLDDGSDGLSDSDGDGLADALDCDSDDDGLPDGLESGVAVPGADTDVARGCFRADEDPATTTDPDAADTDAGGVSDGDEDANGNGAVDAAETDPLARADDGCATSPPPEVRDLRVSRENDVAILAWAPVADPCATYVVLDSQALPAMADAVSGLLAATFRDARPLAGARLRGYLVVGESPLHGRGPDGR